MKTDLTEFDRLESLLMSEENGFVVTRKDRAPEMDGEGLFMYTERHSIIVTMKDGEYLWDAICHPGSYGYEQGLLEVMGVPVVGHGDVEGWLTADQVFERWQKWEADHGENKEEA